jgi:argininosuccinate lyase
VAFALDRGKELDQLSLEEMQAFCDAIDADLFDALTVEQVIDRRTSKGGTATDNVRAAVLQAMDRLAAESPSE